MENNMERSRNTMEGKLDKRVKEKNETKEKGRKSSLNLAKVEESAF